MIALVEDDQVLREELAKALQNYGFKVNIVTRFDAVVEEIMALNPILVILDINLPFQDGYSVCRGIRQVSDVPILMLTSRQSDMDELMGMHMGADDYVTKPYHLQILIARIEALLKRSQSQKIYRYKGLSLDVERSEVSFEDQRAVLTKNESRILLALLQHQEKIVDRGHLMEVLWQSEAFIDDNTLSVNVNRLRKTLEGIGAVDFIHTKRGMGYLLCH